MVSWAASFGWPNDVWYDDIGVFFVCPRVRRCFLY